MTDATTFEPTLPTIAPSAAEAPAAFGVSRDLAPEGSRERALLETARRYLAAIERDTAGDPSDVDGALPFYHDDVVQEELPNRLVPAGARRDLAAIRDAAGRGRRVLAAQRYAVRTATACGPRVVLEVLWVGTLAVPLGAIPAGGAMRAHFAVFLDFRDGRVIAQRNYDCFEAF